MRAQEIREKFTKFFEKNGHEKVGSSPLIPQNDPTLLFANAGMNQFKDYFTGKAKPNNPRAVSIQKCVRAGGKHNDLENVGFTARHHTFFEMLGNFSFGDYFKSDAIAFAWKFLTEDLKIPKDKLYVTCHESDQEAADLWHKEQGVPKDRIFFLGDKDNFWEMGEVGPCGPCSEIFYDHGPKHSDGADTSKCLLADEGRYVEIWNLVFMQYEKYKEGNEIKRKELPKPSVDTGAGLERIAAAMQGVYWNYDSDIFAPILSTLEKLSHKSYKEEKYQGSFRVIADHARSCTMLITDGVIPSNEGRGYVLRRIIRRAVRHLKELGIKEASFHKLVPAVFESLGKEYPQNASNAALAEKMLKLEEEKFRSTLDFGLNLIEEEIKKVKKGFSFPGDIAFKLYDTYGFPIDLTEVILAEKKIPLDMEGFEDSMAKQKAQSKKASKFATTEDNIKLYYQLREKYGMTNFLGYQDTFAESELLDYQDIDGTKIMIFKDTPFYGESGGQAGDSGKILAAGRLMGQMGIEVRVATVVDTQKPVEGLIVHIVEDVKEEMIEIGSPYDLAVDKLARSATMKNHSATHLLQSALIKVLGEHVKQAGSMVDSERLRFDFTHPKAMTKTEITKVTELVNEAIEKSMTVDASVMSMKEAQTKGALALFGEKYGDEVRVLQMGDFSTELCGGTHVHNTSDIGLFTIISEASLSSGIRRVEALTSKNAFNYLQERSDILAKVETSLSTKGEQVIDKVTGLQTELRNKQKEISTLEDQIQAFKSKDMFTDGKTLKNGIQLVVSNLKDGSAKDFRSLSDKFIDANQDGVLLLYLNEGDKLAYLLRTHKKNKQIDCASILKTAGEDFGGRGGGRPDMAQGSGECKKPMEFLSKVESLLGEV